MTGRDEGRWPRRAFRLSAQGRERRDAQAELQFHLQERVEELMSRGVSREQAEAEVRSRFGDPERIGAELETIDTAAHRRQSWRERMHAVGRDVRYAVRGMAARPGYTAIVVVTLALAIGANTAIYSAVNSVLLRPLPVEGLDQLRVLRSDLLALELLDADLSAGEVLDLGERSDLFEAVTGITPGNVTLTGSGEPRRLAQARTMGDFAGVFGMRPIVGRFYDAGDSEPGQPAVAVLSYGIWQEMTGGDPDIVGSTVTLNDNLHEVIGVMPPDFRYPRTAQIWTPFTLTEQALSPQRRGSLIMTAVARLQPGITPEQLDGQIVAEVSRWREQHSEGASYGDDASAYRLQARPFVEYLSGELRPILLVLMGAVSFVLLIACANVASLQLVRTTGRAREIAVRAALGAGRWPIVRQFLVENVLLALLGGALGLLLGMLALSLLARWDASQYELLRDVRLDGAVLAFTAGVTLLAGLMFGVAPAWRASRARAQDALKESGGRGASLGVGRHRFLQGAVVAQVALTLVLLLGSGVMVRSLAQLLESDPGFRADQVTTMQIAPPANRYPRVDRIALYHRITDRVRALPGVLAAGMTGTVPFSDMIMDSNGFSIIGAPPPAEGQGRHANAVPVTSQYFQAMGMPLRGGRYFTDSDRGDGAPVAIIDQQLAEEFFPGENPVGRQINHYGFEGVTIVGVVGKVNQHELGATYKATIYYPYDRVPFPWAGIAVRSSLDAGTVATMVRNAVGDIDPQLPIYDVQTMEQRVGRSVGARWLAVVVLGGFAALALLLAVLGTYGVLSYSTSQRKHELGIRMALGAEPKDMIGMVLRNGLVLAAIGLVLGVVGYLGVGHMLQSRMASEVGDRPLLYDVSLGDPVALAVGIGVLLAAAGVACWVPAWRAARVDPIAALRAE